MNVTTHLTLRFVARFVTLFAALGVSYYYASVVQPGHVHAIVVLMTVVLTSFWAVNWLFKHVVTPVCPECGGSLRLRTKGRRRRIFYRCTQCEHEVKTNVSDRRRRRVG